MLPLRSLLITALAVISCTMLPSAHARGGRGRRGPPLPICSWDGINVLPNGCRGGAECNGDLPSGLTISWEGTPVDVKVCPRPDDAPEPDVDRVTESLIGDLSRAACKVENGGEITNPRPCLVDDSEDADAAERACNYGPMAINGVQITFCADSPANRLFGRGGPKGGPRRGRH